MLLEEVDTLKDCDLVGLIFYESLKIQGLNEVLNVKNAKIINLVRFS